ncbi:hypothetical protein [Flavobacterium sp. CSZ]|uniref:hypothetical protein n=1 Tax=Flavobacterium sp. CSZ TaxID=2783791 RepID=UPI00188C77C8|nr:hypothetical protein [Flavobacterium sp. CSZ]MBF4484446.1 hypothetical protein [Flavobacterium sp. CSZ]
MKNHTLILSAAKVTIPENATIDFITSLINRGLTGIEYFGPEIDSQEDFIEPDMKLASEDISHFEFFFDTEEPIEYELLSETDVDGFILDLIKKSANIDLRADGKDILVYL